MGGGVGFASWFLPVYLGFFGVVAAVAVVLIVAVARVPADRFPGGWPAPRLRWAAIPAAALAVLAVQLLLIGLAFLPGRTLFLAARDRLAPGAAAIGLATILLALGTLAEGVLYLLRIVYPKHPVRPTSEDDGGIDSP